MTPFLELELARARLALDRGALDRCFAHLERAHVLGQRDPWRHALVHWRMLVAGARARDLRELAGQLPRIVAALVFSRIWVPRGNTGRARVSAFRPMPVPHDLRHLVP